MSQRVVTVIVLAVITSMAGCATSPAEGDPVQIRLDDIDTRVGNVERVVNNQSLAGLAQRIDAMQSELRALRGDVEQLQNSAESARKQQRDVYGDLDRRVAAIEARVSGVAAVGTATTGIAGSAASAAGQPSVVPGGAAAGESALQREYARAFDALKAAQYPAAIAGFRGFLAAHEDAALADNAQYWLGETYYATRDYAAARDAFARLGSRWPNSRKAPDAQLKLGYSQFELKQLSAARATLADVVKRFPGSEAARLAAERLTRWPAAAN